MDGLIAWALLLLGNAALFALWLHWVAKFLFNKCPHCGDSLLGSSDEYPVRQK